MLDRPSSKAPACVVVVLLMLPVGDKATEPAWSDVKSRQLACAGASEGRAPVRRDHMCAWFPLCCTTNAHSCMGLFIFR